MPPRVTPRKRRQPATPVPVSTEEESGCEPESISRGATAGAGPRSDAGLSSGAAAGAGPSVPADATPESLDAVPSLGAAPDAMRNAMKSTVSEVIDEVLSKALDQNGPVAALVRSVCKEELAAHAERQPKPDTIAATISKTVTAAVVHVVKTTPQARNVYEMGRDELEAAAKKSVSGFKKFREHLPQVLSRRMSSIAADVNAPDDVLTIFFPAAAKKNKTYSNVEFEKIIMSLLNTIYKLNWIKPKEERPYILQLKQQLDVNALDVLDQALLSLGRTALHEGRSEARKLFFKLFAVYFMATGASMVLEAPEATVPVLGAGSSHAYFAVVQKIRASASGTVHALPSSSVHLVTRTACLYTIAGLILQGMVLKPHAFAPEVVHAAACNLREILVTTVQITEDGSTTPAGWTTEVHKDAEARQGPGVWSLLLPMNDRRPALLLDVQRLTPTERQDIRAAEQARAAAATAIAGAPGGANPGPADSGQPSWL